ncbi:MAG: SDR family oxidoreductase [bacterium]
MILVVGATGQLGTAVTRKLVAAGKEVRILVRPGSQAGHLQATGVEVVEGDLRDLASLNAACRDVNVVVATANAIIRPRGDDFESVEGAGYRNLIKAAEQQGVRQFIFPSVPDWSGAEKIPVLKYKRLNEQRLQSSQLSYTIVRFSVFMDVWLALLGSHIPSRGVESPTVARPFWFSRLYMGLVGGLIEKRGLAIVPGSGNARHAFITVDDAARFLVQTIDHPQAQRAVLNVGGPEVLSWNEALDLFGAVLGRKIRRIPFPAPLARANRALLNPIAEGPANIMGMMATVGTQDSAYDRANADLFLQEPMKTMRSFLEEKVIQVERGSAPQAIEA